MHGLDSEWGWTMCRVASACSGQYMGWTVHRCSGYFTAEVSDRCTCTGPISVSRNSHRCPGLNPWAPGAGSGRQSSHCQMGRGGLGVIPGCDIYHALYFPYDDMTASRGMGSPSPLCAKLGWAGAPKNLTQPTSDVMGGNSRPQEGTAGDRSDTR